MSTYFGFYCQTCEKSSDHWFNHGESLVREIYDRRFDLLRLRSCRWIEIEILGDYTSEVLDYIGEHSRHRLFLETEYGKRVDLMPEKAETMPNFAQIVESAADSFDGEFTTTTVAGRINELFSDYEDQNTPVGKWLIARELNRLRKKSRVEVLRRNESGVRGSVNIYVKTPQW